MNTNFKAFRSTIKQPKGDSQIVGFLDSNTLRAIAETLPAIDLKSTAAAVFDRKTVHLAGDHKLKDVPQQVWPDEWIHAYPVGTPGCVPATLLAPTQARRGAFRGGRWSWVVRENSAAIRLRSLSGINKTVGRWCANRIGKVLSAFALQPVRGHQVGGDDARIQAQGDQLAGPVVGAGAGFHGHHATGW